MGTSTCEQQLYGIDFIGGTFVEYNYNPQGVELFRGTICEFVCQNNAFNIETEESKKSDAFLKLGTPHLYSTNSSVSKVGDIWLIDTGTYCGWMCAISPKETEIPKDYFNKCPHLK